MFLRVKIIMKGVLVVWQVNWSPRAFVVALTANLLPIGVVRLATLVGATTLLVPATALCVSSSSTIIGVIAASVVLVAATTLVAASSLAPTIVYRATTVVISLLTSTAPIELPESVLVVGVKLIIAFASLDVLWGALVLIGLIALWAWILGRP